ncbi:hypothetical protein [Actinacidiphila rubida]|uniref:Uncharacterized protein n=1 Tax=Actinacidiphila rubida TaxID=310780 RepID=A0A1H8KZW4_9ACTN|nr:hypothetical protein [Actinacidiphila rubida]SEN98443.1 hypothetical protein SAMN05216267_1014179 [Actinacidiphila rubida]
MSDNFLTRRERLALIRVTLNAAVAGLVRAVATWLLDRMCS